MSKPSLDDYLTSVPSEVLEQHCSDKFLADVAGKVEAWELLAPYFNIDRGEKHSIKASYILYDEQKQEFLFKWKEKSPGRVTNRTLLEAIYGSNDLNLLHNACRLLQKNSYGARDSSSSGSNVSPVLLKYQNNLKLKYRAHKPVMMTEWPPPCSMGYIKLVLVPKNKVEKGEITNEDVYARLCQSYDEEIDISEEVEIDKLLELDENERKVIIFEGPPGSGKSTLLWHICQLWQSGEKFQQYSMVLLVQMRDPAYHNIEANSLVGMVPSDEIASEIQAVNGEGVLLLLDGWDEAPVELCKEDSYFHNLIAKPSNFSMEKAVVVISSRPLANDDIWMHLSHRVELCGFTKEMRNRYIRESLGDDVNGAQSLIDKIDEAEEADAIDLSLPISVVSLIHIFSATGGELPPTPCRMAIQVVLSIILRNLKKKSYKSLQALKSFDDLPYPAIDWFNGICKLAYDGIANQKYSFSTEDLAEKGVFVQEDGVSVDDVALLGILQPVSSLASYGTVINYHFLHLLHQEFCAAYHITKLPAEAHKDAFTPLVPARKYKNFYSFQSICKFYVASTSREVLSLVNSLGFYLLIIEESVEDSSDESSSDTSKTNSNHKRNIDHDSSSGENSGESSSESSGESSGESSEDEEKHDILYKEADSKYIADCAGRCYVDTFSLEFAVETMSTQYVNKVMGKRAKFHILHDTERIYGKFISMSTSVESLTYYMHYFSNRVFTVLENKQHLKEFSISIFYCVSDCAIFEKIGNTLLTCPALEQVIIKVRFSEDISNFNAFTKSIENLNIVTLDLNMLSGIEDTKFATLAPAFINKRYVKIQCKEVGLLGLQVMKRVFLESKTLSGVELAMDKYSGEDKEMFEIFTKSSLMWSIILSCLTEKLSISASEVGRVLLSGNLHEIANIFRLNKSLGSKKHLHVHILGACLEVCQDEGHDQYFKSVGYFDCRCYHKSLIKVRDQIGLEGLRKLTECLQSIQVEKLNLTAQIIGNEGAVLLAECKTICLKELIVRQCEIGKDGIQSLFAGLRNNKSLTKLDAGFNDFGDSGAVEIARFINETSLQVLDVCECGIGEEGMVAISTALRTNTILQDLNIYNKEQLITQRSEEELSMMLLQNRTLCELKVNQCENELIKYLNPFQPFRMSLKSMEYLKENFSESDIYLSFKQSQIAKRIELDGKSALAQALSDGDIETAANILQLNQPPRGKRFLYINMDDGSVWMANYHTPRLKIHQKSTLLN